MEERFSNHTLDVNALPSLDNINYQKLSPHYPKIATIQALIPILLALTIIGLTLLTITLANLSESNITDMTKAAETSLTGITLGAIVVAFFLVILLFSYQEAKIKRYCLREHDLIFQYGLLTKRTVVQPLLRVQHLEVSQNPLEARWDLASLKLYSAGGFRYTFAIPGLDKHQAEQIRQFIVAYQETHNE